MVLRLRLARPASRRHSPLYNIVLARDRTARDSKPLEVLGTYDPTPQTPLSVQEDDAVQGQLRKYKDIKLDLVRTKYWLGVGAQPSEPVARILALLGLVQGRPTTGQQGMGEGKRDKA